MKFRLIIDPTADEEVVATVHSPSALTDRLEQLVSEASAPERIAAYDGEDIRMLAFPDIECITVLEGRTYAIDSHGRKLRLKQRLYELEALLPGTFFRINKSTLANEKRLERFTATFRGGVDAVFCCGYREYVSRRCFAQIKRRFDSK